MIFWEHYFILNSSMILTFINIRFNYLIMNRQIYQQYGFVIALIIAGISLPTSIILLTRETNIVMVY